MIQYMYNHGMRDTVEYSPAASEDPRAITIPCHPLLTLAPAGTPVLHASQPGSADSQFFIPGRRIRNILLHRLRAVVCRYIDKNGHHYFRCSCAIPGSWQANPKALERSSFAATALR